MLDPIIHQATRLRIMAALFRNREASFAALRDGLGLTDGNLGSHAAALERAGYLAARRALTRGGFEVRDRITPEGSRAFIAYAEALNALLAMDALQDAVERTPHPSAPGGTARAPP